MAFETTFVLVKPDGIAKNLQDKVKEILIRNGFHIAHERMHHPDHAFARRHLSWKPEFTQTLGGRVERLCHERNIRIDDTFMAGMTTWEIGKTFEDFIVDYNAMGPCLAMIVQGENAVSAVDELCGYTIPDDAAAHTIRGQLCSDTFEACIEEQRAPYNVVHSADSADEAHAQIAVWFPEYIFDDK